MAAERRGPGVFAKNDELVALLRAVADEGAVFAVHGRAYVWISPFYRPMFLGPPHNVRSAREQLKLARESRVRIQLSHQIFIGRRVRSWPGTVSPPERGTGGSCGADNLPPQERDNPISLVRSARVI
jgi:hypothetical protein